MQRFVEWAKTRAKKEKIIENWRSLDPIRHSIIPMKPKGPVGTSYDDDGIRITGTRDFVDSILVRLKDVLRIEDSPNMRLEVRYIATDYRDPNKMQPTYAVYVNCVERDQKTTK